MTFLALDLGTYLGFAIYKDGTVTSGTKKLRVDKRASGVRFLDFRNWILQTINKYGIQKVFFERVYGHTGMEAAHIYGGFMYTLAIVCLELNVECIGLAVKSIKKFMTGTGNATKDQMIIAAKLHGFDPKTDDEADAIAIMLFGLKISKETASQSSKSGSFPALGESGCRAPGSSLATYFFQRVTSNEVFR